MRSKTTIMFGVLRYFSIASAVALAVFTLASTAFYREHEEQQLLELMQNENEILTRSFINTIWPRFSDYVLTVEDLDGNALRARPETEQIYWALEPFGQIENLETRINPGTGLGLPLTNKLIELHGESLELISEAGAGTTVFLRFPASRVGAISAVG